MPKSNPAQAAAAATSKQSFATPDRENAGQEATDGTLKKSTRSSSRIEAAKAASTPTNLSNTVTPPESLSRDKAVAETVAAVDKEGEKHVRFGRQPVSVASSAKDEAERKSKRGLVSRRGGRYGSPGRLQGAAQHPTEVMEFKTFRSPQHKKDDNDTVPTLCSSGSAVSATGVSGAKLDPETKHDPQPAAEEAIPGGPTVETGRPSSISLDASMVDTTSPLAPHDLSEAKGSPPGEKRKSDDASAAATTELKAELDGQPGKRNVTFSPPPPPPSGPMRSGETPKKTPSKSPSAGRFHTLPSLSDSKMASTAGLFLSPSPPHPSGASRLKPGPSFDFDEDNKTGDTKLPAYTSGGRENDHSSQTVDQERERVLATPTDFTFDFGKTGHQQSASFDASGVLDWLKSPTANGMFSPGGFASVSNTPRAAPRTPRTPQVSTSFFFSDVASLPRNSDFGSPRPDAAGKRTGYSNSMICISPLASRRSDGAPGRSGRPGDSLNSTPYRDIFASPRHPGDPRVRGLPMLGDSPAKSLKNRTRHGGEGDLESLHMAERDLMEDEDLSVILSLASQSTPRSAHDVTIASGSHVFRSGGDRKGGAESSANLPGLQLPVIGGQAAGATKLTQKHTSRDHGGANEFTPPPLAIRSSSSGSKEIFLGTGGPKTAGEKARLNSSGMEQKRRKGGMGVKKPNGQGVPPGTGPFGGQAYTPGGPDMSPYYPMPGSVHGMPPGGSMRVVVGGPPPMPKDTGSSPPRHVGSPHRPHYADGKFTRPTHYPPMYPPHPMGMPHYYPPHPHPGHMMYSGPPPSGGAIAPKKGKGPKGAGKRPGEVKDASAKKPRKSPNKGGRKKKATTVSDPAERQKAAAAIKAMNAASGGSNDKAANLAAAIMRGVTMRPSGKWQAQLYYAGKSRYIGVFDTREKAALAYEIAREKLKEGTIKGNSEQSLKATETAVNLARKAAFEGVNERDPRVK